MWTGNGKDSATNLEEEEEEEEEKDWVYFHSFPFLRLAPSHSRNEDPLAAKLSGWGISVLWRSVADCKDNLITFLKLRNLC